MKKNNKGFTLIEIIVALALFAIVMTISMGSILGIFEANRKSRALKTVMSNVNIAVETLSREMRFGKAYHCGNTGTQTTPQNCPSGSNYISFLSQEGNQITYRLNGTAIEKQINSGEFIPITASDLIVDNLNFYTLGAGTGTLQPKILILVKGHAISGRQSSSFALQTLVSQRMPEY